MKSPRLRFVRFLGVWQCSGLGIAGTGRNVLEAYADWLEKVIFPVENA